ERNIRLFLRDLVVIRDKRLEPADMRSQFPDRIVEVTVDHRRSGDEQRTNGSDGIDCIRLWLIRSGGLACEQENGNDREDDADPEAREPAGLGRYIHYESHQGSDLDVLGTIRSTDEKGESCRNGGPEGENLWPRVKESPPGPGAREAGTAHDPK